MTRLPSLILLACLPLMAFSAGTIYTWQDENGITHFGDRPPIQAEVSEVEIQGKKKAAVVVDELLLAGEWFGHGDQGDEIMMSLNQAGNIIFTHTKDDLSVFSYQGVWSLENTSMTVITEFTQEVSSNGSVSRSVEPVQIIYTITRFDEFEMEFITGPDRFTVSKT